jgi:hypothetical protein
VGDLNKLASGSSGGLSGAFHILRFLQCDERDMDILALCVPNIAVEEELQEHMDMVHEHIRDDRRALEDMRTGMCTRLGARTFYDRDFWEGGSDSTLSAIHILDVHRRRPLRDVEGMRRRQVSEALALTMLTCPEPHFRETADSVLATLIRRNRVGLDGREWCMFAACVAGWMGNAHIVQWAIDTASTFKVLKFNVFAAIAQGAAANGLDDVFEAVVMAIHDRTMIEIYYDVFWAPISHLTKGKAWTDSVIAHARAQAAL